ncbi:hypothetical protein ACFQZE_06430 [Paenibacillus sp. GCM10027627]|uniref:hypothetical protein n=1 Tax=unclassified Paenibacillus TaxID=185978 RepID=UPI003631AF20
MKTLKSYLTVITIAVLFNAIAFGWCYLTNSNITDTKLNLLIGVVIGFGVTIYKRMFDKNDVQNIHVAINGVSEQNYSEIIDIISNKIRRNRV